MIYGNPAVIANDVRDCDNNAMMKTQQDGGYQFDVSDDILETLLLRWLMIVIVVMLNQ